MSPRAAVGYVSEVFVSFQGEGARAGERHLFVRLAGCNIRCRYCDTPDSLERTLACVLEAGAASEEILPNPIPATELRHRLEALIAREGPIDAIAVTGGEPLVQADFIAQLFAGGSPGGLPVLLETNGMLPIQLAKVIEFVDVVSMDIKPPSNTGERPFWDEHERFLALARACEVYVKVLVDDGTDVEEVGRAARLVAAGAPTAPLFLQPITLPEGAVAIGPAALARMFKEARRYVSQVRVLPQTHKMMRIQ